MGGEDASCRGGQRRVLQSLCSRGGSNCSAALLGKHWPGGLENSPSRRVGQDRAGWRSTCNRFAAAPTHRAADAVSSLRAAFSIDRLALLTCFIPVGMTEISRRLSAATPPDHGRVSRASTPAGVADEARLNVAKAAPTAPPTQTAPPRRRPTEQLGRACSRPGFIKPTRLPTPCSYPTSQRCSR